MHLLDVGPGDYFGEIALLKDVPRTASVTAVVDSVLYALGRDAFLVAVTGHAASVVLARQVVTERQPEDGGQPLQTGDPASVRRGPTVWCRWSTTETIEGGPREGHAAGLGGKSVLEAAVSLGSQPPAVTFEHPYQLPELQWRDAVRDGGQRLASVDGWDGPSSGGLTAVLRGFSPALAVPPTGAQKPDQSSALVDYDNSHVALGRAPARCQETWGGRAFSMLGLESTTRPPDGTWRRLSASTAQGSRTR